MTPTQVAYLLVIVIPLFAVWVLAVVDVVRQPHMTTRVKWMWALSFSLVWPLLIVYLLSRPVQGRFERAESRDYPHARLVDAALAHEDGRLDDAQLADTIRQLRAR
ncbi:MAG: hypothetical protein MUF09_07030 [Candidatus Nanopelagicales bacterium]|nr:hypothetical protein [Candidatus Nanopelagicales bacterium]